MKESSHKTNAQQYTLVLPIKIHSYAHDELRRFLQVQLRSLNKFLDISSVYEFLIICREKEIGIIQKALLKHPSPLPIRLIPETSIVTKKVIANTSGWYLQQILKLAVANIVKTPLYLILDTDCFLTKAFTYNDLFHEGKIIVDTVPWTNEPYRWFWSMDIIDGVSFNELSAQLAISVTPQILVTDVVRQLLTYLYQKESSLSWDEYLSSRKFTEFTLYWLFLLKIKKLDLYQLGRAPSLLGNALWLPFELCKTKPKKKCALKRLWKKISPRQREKIHAQQQAIKYRLYPLVEKQVQTAFESNSYFHFSLIQSNIDDIQVEWIIEQTKKYLT